MSSEAEMKRVWFIFLALGSLQAATVGVVSGDYTEGFRRKFFATSYLRHQNYEAGLYRFAENTGAYGEVRFKYYPFLLEAGHRSEDYEQGYLISGASYSPGYSTFAHLRPFGSFVGLRTGLLGYDYGWYRRGAEQLTMHRGFIDFDFLLLGIFFTTETAELQAAEPMAQAKLYFWRLNDRQFFVEAKVRKQQTGLVTLQAESRTYSAQVLAFRNGQSRVSPMAAGLYKSANEGVYSRVKTSWLKLSAFGNRRAQWGRLLLHYGRLGVFAWRNSKRAALAGFSLRPGEGLSLHAGGYSMLHERGRGFLTTMGAGFGQLFRLGLLYAKSSSGLSYTLDTGFLPGAMYADQLAEDQGLFYRNSAWGAMAYLNFKNARAVFFMVRPLGDWPEALVGGRLSLSYKF